MEKLYIILLGPPGAGKGTQAKKIAKRYGIPHIESGRIFREIAKGDSELSKMVKKCIELGGLVPDEIVNRIIKERLLSEDCQKGCILDGYPRTMNQVEALDSIIDELGGKILVISLHIDKNQIIERNINRLICPVCGAIYNLRTNPPKEDLKCDECGSKLEKRMDDEKLEILCKRIEVYEEYTKPIIEHYIDRGIVKIVDASQASEKIFEEIKNIIDLFHKSLGQTI